MRRREVIGLRFGRLIVLRDVATPGARKRLLECRCDCGEMAVVALSNMTTGHTKSCGCLNVEGTIRRSRTHGFSDTATHRVWMSMRDRCGNPKNKRFAGYGGRGIVVCERWQKFENFRADMGERPDGMTLDRFPNNDGNYEPGNCRWATWSEQAQNKRNNLMIEIDGQTKCLAGWSRILGVNAGVVQRRISRGWPRDKALLEPKKSQRAKRVSFRPRKRRSDARATI